VTEILSSVIPSVFSWSMLDRGSSSPGRCLTPPTWNTASASSSGCSRDDRSGKHFRKCRNWEGHVKNEWNELPKVVVKYFESFKRCCPCNTPERRSRYKRNETNSWVFLNRVAFFIVIQQVLHRTELASAIASMCMVDCNAIVLFIWHDPWFYANLSLFCSWPIKQSWSNTHR